MPRSRTSRGRGDASIMRGAALIRNEISRQFNLNEPRGSPDRQPPPTSSQLIDSPDDCTAFSDIWRNCGPVTPPRMEQQRAVNESLEYSMDESMVDEVRTFQSKGDASQWADGAALVSPADSCGGSPNTQMGRDKAPTMKVKTHYFDHQENYDFIENDYIDEFELDDYDEVCHPLYSRKESVAKTTNKAQPKPLLKRNVTPPTCAQENAHQTVPEAPKKRGRQKGSPSASTLKIVSRVALPKPKEEKNISPRSTALFDEHRQGPPSPDNSFNSSVASSHQEKNHNAHVPSPLQMDYDLLLQDPAYRHAQRAGHLWQSLVGHHIRFPSRWWNGARAPPLGLDNDATWQYVGRYASNDKRLRQFVKNRASPGRLLLHIVMLDLVTCKPLQDICVGCFHPSARGIRETEKANPNWEGVRDLWLAVRKRMSGVSVMDAHLNIGQEAPTKSPLGAKRKVTNQNVRAVFGELPPVETLFVPESYLYELYITALKRHKHAASPPLLLLQEFVFA